ncbi:hypothetical protein [Methylocystis echinoides]|jgi:hypothetical protein|uniref:hypothetical protein n=1 Tax=Methylocystis echinoides TaxID=29468 RepID=UPI00343C1186
MHKIMIIAAVAPFLLAAPVQADESERQLGNVQRYGGHWRHMRRDWSGVYGYATPGICWQFDYPRAQWVWTC